MMKKTILVSALFLFFGLAPHVFAQGFTALAPVPGLTSSDVTSVVNTDGFANFFNNLYKYCIGLAAVFAIIEIIWGGLEISTQDSISKQGAGRERITQAIYGLILVLSPVLVFSIINPNILNLSLSLKKIDLTPAPAANTTVTPYVQQPGTTQAGTLGAVNNNTVIGFSTGAYPSATQAFSKAWCYPLATTIQDNNPAVNNGAPFQATVWCDGSQLLCQRDMNGSGGTPYAAPTGATCTQVP